MMGSCIMLYTVHTTQGQGQEPGNDGFLDYAIYCSHYTGTGTGTGKWWVPVLCYILFTLHRDWDRNREMMGSCIMLYTVHTTQGQGQGPGNDGFLYYALYCSHYTGTGTGTGKWWVPVLCYILFTLHRDWDRDREMMGSCIMLYTVHTTQGQGQEPGNDGFLDYAIYCSHYTGTGTGTGKWWVPVLCYILFTLHRDWDRNREMMGSCIMLYTVHTTQGQGQGPGNDGFLYYAIYCSHYTGTGTGTGKWWVPVLCYILFTLHRDQDRDREMMGSCIMLYTVHTTQGQGQGLGNDGFLYYAIYCSHYTGTRTGTGKWWVPVLCYILFTLHRDRDRDWEMMGSYIMLYTVHTTQGQGQGPGNDGFLYYAIYCSHYTGTGTGTGNHCFLLYSSRSRSLSRSQSRAVWMSHQVFEHCASRTRPVVYQFLDLLNFISKF